MTKKIECPGCGAEITVETNTAEYPPRGDESEQLLEDDDDQGAGASSDEQPATSSNRFFRIRSA